VEGRPPEEEDLVARAQRGDVDAYEQLVRAYQRIAFRIAFLLSGNASDAEEAAQDGFVDAWRSLTQYRGDASFRAWLARIVTRRCLDVVAARRPTVELPPVLEQPGGDVGARAEERDRLRALVEAILALPPDARAALVLREFQGLSYAEVGEALGASLPAVKGRIHRARLELAAMMEGWR